MQGAAGGRGTADHRASNGVVCRLLVVLCSDLRFSCLNLRGIRRVVAAADVIAGLLETNQLRARVTGAVL